MKNKLILKYQKRAYLYMALSLFFVITGIWSYLAMKPIGPSTESKDTVKKSKEVPTKADSKVEEPDVKEAASISVPYTVQAPNANWAVHEESCEEAALLMYHQFLVGDKTEKLDPATVDASLRQMKKWQVTNYGTEPDLSIEKLGLFAKDYYGHNYRVTKNGTIENIKKEISAGNPVLVPVMTHSLLNPRYGRENTYHILLIKGYRSDGVITNDAGISQGKDYFYSWEVLFLAIDAQTPKMNQGRDLLVLSNS